MWGNWLVDCVPNTGRPGHVDVVPGPPEPPQDGDAVERSVSHDVELFSRHQPGWYCRLFSLTQKTVRVSAAEDLHGGVSKGLEPPEHSIWELRVEISDAGKVSRVTEVNEAVVTVELAEDLQSLGVLAGDVVINPQPPARVQPPGSLSQSLEQTQEPFHSVGWLTIGQVPGGRIGSDQEATLLGDEEYDITLASYGLETGTQTRIESDCGNFQGAIVQGMI